MDGYARAMAEGSRPRRVVIDTDTANEIDDQFALAWALRRPDRIRLEGVHAAPFSHGRYFRALAEAARARGHATTTFEHVAVGMDRERLAALVEETPPGVGMERSHAEILRVFEAAGVDPGDRIARGSGDFLPGPDAAVESEAVDRLVALAREATPGDPIHVAVIGAPTNVASALLVAPEIAPNLVVLFLAGFPSGAGLDDDSFNLVQDRFASNVLFESEVLLVYIPGYHVAETLQLSLPAARAWLEGRGALAHYLYETYRANPINPRVELPGRSWVLWDVIATAWLVDPAWVPTRRVPRARVEADHRWTPLPGDDRFMDEAWHVDRNAVLEDLFARVAEPPRGRPPA